MPTLPPGPTSHPAVQTYRYLRAPFAFLDECTARYGDKFTLRFVRQPPIVNLNDADALKDLLAAPTDVVEVGLATAPFEYVVGRFSVVRLDGKRHERERRLLMPPFHGERLATYSEQIIAAADRMIDRTALGETFSILPAMQTLTLEVILECVFGITPGPQQDRFRELLQTFIREGIKPYLAILAALVPGAALHELMVKRVAKLGDLLSAYPVLDRLAPVGLFARSTRDLDRLLLDDIAARRAEGTAGRTDVMSMLIAARDEDGRGLTDEELHDEMITLLIAGYETTAATLAFAVSKLLECPALLDRVREELERVVGSLPPSPERLRDLKYLDATIKEVLRLYGPAPGLTRVLARPLRLGGYDLPAGVIVTASTYLLHRDPRYWPDPGSFDPTRFLDRRVRPTEFAPFGGGPRTCLGAAFALFEIKTVLARLLTRTTLRAVPGPPLGLARRGLMFGPTHDVPVVLARRRESSATPPVDVR